MLASERLRDAADAGWNAPGEVVVGEWRLTNVMDGIWRDLGYALRSMRRSPGFSAAAIATLALGIGANTAIYSLADAVLLRSLPVTDPANLVVLRQRSPDSDVFPFSTAAAEALGQDNDVLSGLAVFRPTPDDTHVRVNGETELALTQAVSGDYHGVLGVQPILGRALTEEDREPVAVISHRYWQRRFAGDPAVLGRPVEVQNRSFAIVGVTPPEFFGTQPGRYIDVTVPLAAQQARLPPQARWLYLIGRLAPGVSREQARAALQLRWSQLDATQSRGWSLELDPGAQGLNELRRQFSTPLQILMVVAGAILLVACANLGGLLVVRSRMRQQEMAVRLSLGAARARIVRQLLTESALFAALGGAAGVALAYGSVDLLVAMMSRGRVPIVLDAAPQLSAFMFAAAITALAAVLFGLMPALVASRSELQHTLKASAPGASRGSTFGVRAMVAAQVALVVLLLTSAGLFARTLQNLRNVDAGFAADATLVVQLSRGPAYQGADALALYGELLERFGALPGVRSASMSMDTPPVGLSMNSGISVPARADAGALDVWHNLVGPRFFETMGIPVLAGRDITATDDATAPRRVVVSERVARHYFGDGDPLGQQILLPEPGAEGAVAAEIIGVVQDVRYTGFRVVPPFMVYRPYSQETRPAGPPDTFLVRAAYGDVTALTPALHAEFRRAAPDLPLPSIVPLSDGVAAALVQERMLAALSVAIGLLAALLAAIGIYGTVAAAVARREREIGIRLALGARGGQVGRMVLAEALAMVLVGLLIGVPATLTVGRAMSGVLAGVLFEVSPTDVSTIAAVAGAILAIALLAAYVPARRASTVDPVGAIKCE